MQALKVRNGNLAGQTYYLVNRLLIGRHPKCNIVLDSKRVSRRHALVLVWANGKILLRDLASRNGTYVRGRRVRQAELKPGDVFSVGDCRFELQTVEGSASLPPDPAEPSEGLDQLEVELRDRTTRPNLLALARSWMR